MIKRMLEFISPYWKRILLALIASLMYAVMNAFAMWITATFVKTLFDAEKAEVQVEVQSPDTAETARFSFNDYLKQKTQDLVQRDSKTGTLRMVCIVIFIAFFLKNFFEYTKNILIAQVNYQTVNAIRNRLYAHVQRLSLRYFDQTKGGRITSILVNDVQILSQTLTQSFGKLIVTPMEIVMTLSILFIISWKMSIVVFLLLPLFALVVTQIGGSIRRKSRRTFKQMEVFVSHLQETVSALRIVKAFAMENEETKRFIRATAKFYRLAIRQRSLQLVSSPVNEVLAVMALTILLWYGGLQVLRGGTLEAEDFVRYIIILYATLRPMKDLTKVSNQIQTGLAAAERIYSILDSVPEIQDAADAVDVKTFEEAIVFKNVRFRYSEQEPYVLEDVNLRINCGDIVAFVGQSGAGKSTLVDLIPRFYEITEGEIMIDGVDIRRIKNVALKKLFGIVTQETILFNDTLRYNIAYGCTDADEDAIQKAAKVANAQAFIEELEGGYETIVGDRGVKLSGGQRQRIAIARAILQNPPILILDEATSALDSESEKLVQEAIDALMQHRTVLVIAHRLSTILHADQIVVLDRGRIIDRGPHRKLLESCPVYRNLYEMQFRDQEGG